jgi:hypothetical protein
MFIRSANVIRKVDGARQNRPILGATVRSIGTTSIGGAF